VYKKVKKKRITYLVFDSHQQILYI